MLLGGVLSKKYVVSIDSNITIRDWSEAVEHSHLVVLGDVYTTFVCVVVGEDVGDA